MHISKDSGMLEDSQGILVKDLFCVAIVWEPSDRTVTVREAPGAKAYTAMLDAHQESGTALHSYRNWQCCWKVSILNLGQNYLKQRHTFKHLGGICSFSTQFPSILVIILMHQAQSFHTLGRRSFSSTDRLVHPYFWETELQSSGSASCLLWKKISNGEHNGKAKTLK